MNCVSRRSCCLLAASIGLTGVLLFGQSFQQTPAGRDGSRASSLDRQRNVANCRNTSPDCDRSKLSPREAVALAVADHKRNVEACTDGFRSCDLSGLTPLEAHEVARSERERRFSDCKDGLGPCDGLNLT